MNKVILMGRLTRDPEVRYTKGSSPLAIARWTLAVEKKIKQENGPAADFIPCVAFGKAAEFAEKYFRQGMRITISGRIQTGSYTNNEGNKVYTTEVVIEEQEFAESKNDRGTQPKPAQNKSTSDPMVGADGFMNIPEGLEEELPFN